MDFSGKKSDEKCGFLSDVPGSPSGLNSVTELTNVRVESWLDGQG